MASTRSVMRRRSASHLRSSFPRAALIAALLLVFVAGVACAGPASHRQIREWTKLLKSDDPQKRSSAATSLLAADDESALQALVDALNADQPETARVSVITAFGVKGDDRATRQIIAALEDRSEAVRQAAASALQSVSTPRAVELLKQAASDPRRGVETRAQIVGILGDMRALDAIPTLIELLSDEQDALRKAARDSLERITLRSFAAVEEWSGWWERSGKMSREEMIEDLVALQAERLRNREALIEKLYLALLSDRKDRNDPAPLLAALAESESAKVKLYAIKELATLRSKPVVAALVKALEDQDAGVRQVAADTLAAQGDPAAAPDLLKALKDSSAPVRAAAAKSLGVLKVREACPALCDRLSDSSPDVAAAAARALGDLADPAALDPLIKVIGSATVPAVVYEAAAGALAKIKDPRAAPVLISLLQSPKENVRWTAVDALGGLKAKEAVAPLTSVAQKDGNAQIREAAVAALGNIGDATALGPIVDALSDSEKRVADQALRSLVQLADADHGLYGAALDRLLSAQRYAQAETVLAGAADQLGRTPNSADDIVGLRTRTAGGLIAAKEWGRARPHLAALLSKAPKEAKYVKDLSACLLALRDYEAILTLLAQARRVIPDQSAGWWQDTIRAVEQMAADGDATRVVGAVDSLEKEAPELGGEATAAKLRDLRAQAQQKQPPAVDPTPPPAP